MDGGRRTDEGRQGKRECTAGQTDSSWGPQSGTGSAGPWAPRPYLRLQRLSRQLFGLAGQLRQHNLLEIRTGNLLQLVANANRRFVYSQNSS